MNRRAPIKSRKLLFGFFLLLLICLVFFAFSRDGLLREALSFESEGNILQGYIHYIDAESDTLIIFIHGDGDLNYDAYGFYRHYWRAMAKYGVAVFSWDKPGVADSAGNWLDQDMVQRAAEVETALESVQARYPNRFKRIGVMGFSQAGWVLPKLDQGKFDFFIFASTALSWLEQSQYMSRLRLEAEGLSEAAIRKELSKELDSMDQLFGADISYAQYLKHSQEQAPMNEDRFHFVQRSWKEDARDALEKLQKPVLVLHGEEDLNVDGPYNSAEYRRIFNDATHTSQRVVLIPQATHQLSSSEIFNTAYPGLWELVLLEAYGDSAFPSSVLDLIPEWVQTLP